MYQQQNDEDMIDDEVVPVIDWDQVYDGSGHLSLASKAIVTMPEELWRFSLIVDLDLDYNDLRDVPQEFCTLMTSLKRLSVVGNKLQQLPENLDALVLLEDLNLKGNR